MDFPSLLHFIGYSLQANAFLIVSTLLLAGVGLSFLWAEGEELDRFIFVTINSRLPYNLWLDRLMHYIGQAGTLWMGLLIMGAFFLAGYRSLALVGAVGMFVLWGVVRLVKKMTRRARPYAAVKEARLVGVEPTGLAFPSGHAAQSFFTAYYLAEAWSLGAGRWGLFLFAALIAYTRVYVGAHYPRDIVGGALAGLLWGFILLRLLPAVTFLAHFPR